MPVNNEREYGICEERLKAARDHLGDLQKADHAAIGGEILQNRIIDETSSIIAGLKSEIAHYEAELAELKMVSKPVALRHNTGHGPGLCGIRPSSYAIGSGWRGLNGDFFLSGR
jgi:hypothetical protein